MWHDHRPSAVALRDSRRDLLLRLALPRGREQLPKWMLLPIAGLLALGVRGAPPSAAELVSFALLWLVAEQLGYQARYQVNDLRDRRTDAAHPAGRARGRLNFPWTTQRAVAVWSSLLVRVVLAVLVTAWLLDGRFQQTAAWFLALMALTAVLYEALRERVRREQVLPGSLRAHSLGLPVLACIPLGYGLRFWAGYHALAWPADRLGWLPEALLVATALCLYGASTALAWALEATSFLRSSPVPGVSGGGDSVVDPRLGARAHLAVLVAHAGLLLRQGAGRDVPPEPERLVVGSDRPGGRPAAWDLLAAAALLLAHAVLVVAVPMPAPVAGAVVVLGVVSASAPVLVRALLRAPGPVWDARPPWLGRGRLAAVVAVELGCLAGLLGLAAAAAPNLLRGAWLVAFVLFAWGSIRTSSYTRGFGPLSLLARPARWALRGLRSGR